MTIVREFSLASTQERLIGAAGVPVERVQGALAERLGFPGAVHVPPTVVDTTTWA